MGSTKDLKQTGYPRNVLLIMEGVKAWKTSKRRMAGKGLEIFLSVGSDWT